MPNHFRVSRNTAEEFIKLFVNRLAYGIQRDKPLPDGSVPYLKQKRPLDCDAVRMHLNGDITINLYAINPQTQSGHLWILAEQPLLASDCRIYIYNLALRLGVPVKGGGLKDGIEVFPRQDRLEQGAYGNAIRAPLGVHRKSNRRYWFYEADINPEAQLSYLQTLKKLTGAQLHELTDGMALPQAYRPPAPVSFVPRVSVPGQRDFRILDFVQTTGKQDSRNWKAQCPSCARAGRDRGRDNLGIKISDSRFYICRAGCTKEEIRAALGQPIRKMSLA